MIEISSERAEQILHKETPNTEQLPTILRGIYTRYMHLFEKYFADIDALDEDTIAALREYHEETKSLVKYYYMDIPFDICMEIRDFDEKCSAKLLGYDWKEHLSESYQDFKDEYEGEEISEAAIKAKFAGENLEDFYHSMDSVFRDGFGTGSQNAEQIMSGLKGMLFGDN